MSKFGSAHLNLFLVDGVSLLGMKAKELGTEVEAVQEDTTGIGDSWAEFTPTGRLVSRLSQGEAFYDQGTGGAHEVFIASPDTSRLVVYSFEGNAFGTAFYGHAGAFAAKYKVLAQNGNLTKAQSDYTVSGARDEGIILQPLAEQTEAWDGAPVDHGDPTASGGVGYLQVVTMEGFTDFEGFIQHSADGDQWEDLIAFANVEAAPAAQRIEVAGTVYPYLRFVGEVTGDGSVTVFAGFVRHPDPES